MRDRTQADHYTWFRESLESRDIATKVRLFVAATSLLMAGAVLVLLSGPDGPQSPPGHAMMVVAAAGGFAGAAIWLWRWPSHAQSTVFAALTAGSITLACLAYPNPLAALLGCIAFTTISAYVAFFHSARLLIAVSVVFVAVATWQAIRLGAQGHAALAVVDLFLVVQANVAIALAIRSLVRTFKGDVLDASLDPLTGLLNRRAFRRQTLNLVAQRRDPQDYLVVALLDLDKFKGINDTYGHAAGDQALVAVAEALRQSSSRTAVISRSGGEEFLIADLIPSATAVAGFHQVCDAIADLDIPVTASLGTACVPLASVPARDRDGAVTHLISMADMAMYRAKRNGGNQCHHTDAWHGSLDAPGNRAV
ncbi:GGDEF domain-containing protein [Mycobacterium sp. 236(2023)]|uniref:GGDEF domain-containing protein n=1 Tax=Mycobacterium sp. 236(2023) TaxID=3038163 RepID=UPI0024153F33|nr:GGDEF domain-containing protein [Mycobacterium sp. 236(2023)]MDG4665334.1 GGDEF domain-containing protein [Mycobacterium sp. 236(2023)]